MIKDLSFYTYKESLLGLREDETGINERRVVEKGN